MRVARLWQQSGETVYAVTRSAERASVMAESGLVPVVSDICEPASLTGLPPARTVLFAVGYDRRSAHSMHRVYVEGLLNVLRVLSPVVERFLYVSSTGVYGQSDGSWVDEDSPCHPVREGGVACLHAEQALRAHPLGARSIVLRMAGIYGPGRIPRSKQLRAGQPIAAPSQGYLNLIHVDDAARVVMAAEARAPAGSMYCVADGQPVVRSDYYEELARLLGAPRPVFTLPPPDSPALERAGSSKRISNRRLVAQVGFQFEYPSYREGLSAVAGL
jgi:nucleoside-diphosphate-sugar epimerase